MSSKTRNHYGTLSASRNRDGDEIEPGVKSNNNEDSPSRNGDEYDYCDSPEQMIFAQDGDHDNEDPQEHEESVHEEDDDEDNSSNVSDEDVEKKDDSENDPKHSNKSFIDMEFKMHSAYSEESIIEQSLKYWKKQGIAATQSETRLGGVTIQKAKMNTMTG